jgi:hypothetical protein
MRRLALVSLAATGIAATVLAAAAVSLAAGESGPKCADITAETHNYRGTGTGGGPPGPYSFAMELLLAAPACKSITYTVYIVQDPGATPVAVQQSGTSTDGHPQFLTTVNDDDPTICVYATTTSKGGHVHDRAPDATATPDCLELTAPATGGGSTFG